ncbi:hypothetical protein ACFL3S_04990 [Gemmatimonadota bacterium]
MDISSIIIQLISGVVGGNAAGLLNKARSLGPALNSILGAVGGIGGGQLLSGMVGGGTGGNIGTSAVVGALLPLIVSMLKKKA